MDETEFKHAITKKLIADADEKFGDEFIVLAIPGFMSKHFNAYSFMLDEIKTVEKYCEELKSNHSKLIKSAITYSVITLYAKCFMDASKGNAPKLESNQIFQKQEDKDIHDYLMELRHKFLVHRNKNNAEIEASFFLIPKGESTETGVKHLATRQVAFHKDKLEEIIQHLQVMKNIIEEKIQKAAKKVQKGMLNLDKELTKHLIVNNAK